MPEVMWYVTSDRLAEGAAMKFKDFIREIEEEARREGPAAVEQLEAFRSKFRLAREMLHRRIELGLSQRDLAKLAHVQQGEISRIESGQGNPTYQTLRNLARALQADIGLVGVRRAKPVLAAKRVRSSSANTSRRKHR